MLLRCINPKLNGFLCVSQRVFLSVSVCHATRQLGNFCNENFILAAPIKNDLVFRIQPVQSALSNNSICILYANDHLIGKPLKRLPDFALQRTHDWKSWAKKRAKAHNFSCGDERRLSCANRFNGFREASVLNCNRKNTVFFF